MLVVVTVSAIEKKTHVRASKLNRAFCWSCLLVPPTCNYLQNYACYSEYSLAVCNCLSKVMVTNRQLKIHTMAAKSLQQQSLLFLDNYCLCLCLCLNQLSNMQHATARLRTGYVLHRALVLFVCFVTMCNTIPTSLHH